ncbi:S8 family serine peptidase [Bacillus sp. FSL W7-1360]
MKKATSRYAKVACAATLALGMVASSFTFPSQPSLAENGEKKHLYIQDDIDLESEETVSVIVELTEMPEKVAVATAEKLGKKLSEKEAKEKVEVSHVAFEEALEEVSSEESEYVIEKTYETVFNGAALSLPANQVEDLLEVEGVKAIYSNDTVELIAPVEETSLDDVVEPLMANSLPHLGITDMHVDGVTGAGIKVGVLDTGIDYHHPDLTNAYKGGYDFVDGDDDPMEATYDDWLESGLPEFSASGRPYYTNHGTHVAGTIGGQADNDVDMAVLGVAPDADLYAYRVLGPYGSGLTSNVIAAIDQSVRDGMDVINLSLGASVNDPIYPTSIATNNASLAGVTVVNSAGNAGSGLGTVGSPGTAALPIGVGASDLPATITEFSSSYVLGEATLTGDLRVLATSFGADLAAFAHESYELVGAGLGYASDFETIDVEGKIAVISRGEITFNEKIANAKANGAIATIIYNHEPGQGHIPFYLGESHSYIPSFSLTYEQGSAIAEKLEEGSQVTFGDMSEMVAGGDRLADFSSRGPINVTAAIKPEIVAPGVSILSTVPSYTAGSEHVGNYDIAYARMSGTSMSAPHVTGVVALMLQANPDWTPADVKTRLMNTAVPLSQEYNVFEVGAGLIQPKDAVATDMMIQTTIDGLHLENDRLQLVDDLTGAISYGFVSTNDGNIRERESLRFTNSGETAKTFNVDVDFHTVNGTQEASANGIVAQTNTVVSVPAGKTVTNNVFFLGPKTAKQGLYGGYITYTNQDDDDEVYRVPFGAYVTPEAVEPYPVGRSFKE